MDQDRFIREIQQIALIQKKLDELLNSDGSKAQQIPLIIEHLDSTHDFTAKIIDSISSNKIKITEDLFTALNHELKTPLVPIRTYGEMLLQGHFGALNEEQKKRIELLVSNANQLQQKIEALLDRKLLNHISTESDYVHKTKELEQEKILLEKINEILEKKINDKSSEIKELKKDLNESERQKKEFEQEKLILDKTVEVEEQKGVRLAKKNIIVITVAALVVGIGFVAYSVYVVELVGQQYQLSNLGTIPTGYVIQNLRGDTIDTWLSWRLVPDAVLTVGIVNANNYPDKVELIKEVILSEESIEIDDSLLHKGLPGSTSVYYVGWTGALKNAAKNPTQLYIPSKFEVIESVQGEGDITIVLASEKNGDGYSGYAKSIADEAQNQILKSTITIFEVDKLSDEQFKTILRHEFGHAIGLAHSTAPEDLMAPVIQTQYPYISECAISSIIKLYDGSKKSQVICEK
jgi:hypothetical protein